MATPRPPHPARPAHPARPPSGNRPRAGGGQSLEDYQTVAETVGFMPSLRVKDNLIQTVVILVSAAAGAITGYAMGELQGLLIGLFLALLVSTLLSGFVLMILGWVRALKRRKK